MFDLLDVREIREDNLFDFAAALTRKHAEQFLPKAYPEYRERVNRWRDKLREAGRKLAEVDAMTLKAAKERRKAEELTQEARLMDQQLRQTEQEKGWIRTCVL